MIHVSEVGPDGANKLEESFAIGRKVTAKIVKVDCEERKIALSVKDCPQEPESQERESASDQGTVVGADLRVRPDPEQETSSETEPA